MQNILHTLEVQDIALAQEAHGILAPVSSNSSFRTETETVDEEEIEVKLLGKAVGIELSCLWVKSNWELLLVKKLGL